jgi:hypothetical protein
MTIDRRYGRPIVYCDTIGCDGEIVKQTDSDDLFATWWSAFAMAQGWSSLKMSDGTFQHACPMCPRPEFR